MDKFSTSSVRLNLLKHLPAYFFYQHKNAKKTVGNSRCRFTRPQPLTAGCWLRLICICCTAAAILFKIIIVDGFLLLFRFIIC